MWNTAENVPRNHIRVLIVDDHALIRSGLRALLERQPDLEVVGEADDGVGAVERCRNLKADVVLMDLAMPGRDGINATEDIRSSCPAAKVVVVTMHDDGAYMRMARLAGASGFVLKQSLAADLVEAIRSVHAGKTHFPADLPSLEKTALSVSPISARETEVLTLVALGHTTTEIAARLHIGEKTVETHRAHIMFKLGVQTRADLVRFALEHGLLKQ